MAEEAKADTSSQTKPGETTPAGQDTSAKTTEGDSVTLTKAELAEKERLIAVGQGAQKQLARYERVYGKLDGKGGHFKQQDSKPAAKDEGGTAGGDTTATPSTDRGAEEDRKAERLLLGLAVDPEYREVLDADPTLRMMLTSNPLGVLPILAPDALDAQDALELVKEKLDERKGKLPAKTTTTPATTEKVEDKQTTTPGSGGINTQGTDQDAEYEAARKVGNTEQAIAGMIKVKAKRMGGK